MSGKTRRTVEIAIPDAGPLISLARAGALDLLLLFRDEVRVVITDFVELEVTRNKDRFADAGAICDFITKNAGSIEIQETSYGTAMKRVALLREAYEENESLRKAMQASGTEPPSLPKDSGEMSIVSYASELIKNPPGPPVLVLAEDDFFLHSGTATPGNAHILSTRALLETLQTLGLVQDAKRIWKAIQEASPTMNKARVDRSASKIPTEWTGAIDPKKVDAFKAKRKQANGRRPRSGKGNTS